MTGRTLAHYQITEKIGVGGMGEVYKARDTRLGRDVAVKVLPEAFARDADRMARFQQEARTLASLNHPHIAAIYGLEETDGVRALVMEYVPGPTLADRLQSGAIPEEEALGYARQMAEALEAAHEKGIIHRDLKPANIKITPEGQVKLLDFGLAKALHEEPVAGDPEQSPTLTLSATRVGVILGTAGYMAPEQARGEPAGKRADIWAFGVVLWEMLAGRRLFSGETVGDTLAAVLRAEIDFAPLPGKLRPLLSRCLERNVKKRLADIADARLWLEEPAETAPPAALPTRRWLWPALTAILVVLWGVSAWFAGKPQPLPVRHLMIPIDSLQQSTGTQRAVISPDGRRIVFLASGKLWIRDMDREQPRALEGTEGAQGPFWSHASDWVAFAAGSQLLKLPVSGGLPAPVCTLPGNGGFRGGAWTTDDASIFFSLALGGLYEVPGRGGEPKSVLSNEAAGRRAIYTPYPLPASGAERVLAYGLGSLLDQRIIVRNLVSGAQRDLGPGFFPVYSQSGHILFEGGGDRRGLWAVPFSAAKMEILGEAFPVALEAAEPTVAKDGTLVYLEIAGGARHLVWRDREGKRLGSVGQPMRQMYSPAISPDGRRIAVAGTDEGNTDIWIHEMDRPLKTRLTFSQDREGVPRWLPDGKQISFLSGQSNAINLLLQPADGGGEAVAFAKSPKTEISGDWSPDGSMHVYYHSDGDLWMATRRDDGKGFETAPWLETAFVESAPALSPRGDYIAYVGNESGRYEVFVRPFPRGTGKWQVSAEGGLQPRWSCDGKELFYVQGGRMKAVAVSMDSGFRAGPPATLFEHPALMARTSSPVYDVAQDGKRFLLVEPVVEKQAPPTLHVIQNWIGAVGGREHGR